MKNLPNQHDCKIAVIGLGYVGLPLAIEFASREICFRTRKKLNRKIIGFDINKDRINDLKIGLDKTNEVEESKLKKLTNISFNSEENSLLEANVFIVTVPTPIDSSKSPDLSLIKKACKLIGNIIKNSTSKYCPIVIFESTVFPGATEEICIPIIKLHSELKVFSSQKNKNAFAYGYSPERINPGDKKHRISSIVKITSGNNEEVSNWIDKLYGSIIEAGTFKTSSIKIAEAAKVIENTQRDLNIALVNELSKVFRNLNIDTLDVINAAKTKWNFLPFKPGLVGGHCIGVDPYYLTYKSEKQGYYPEVILSGRRINDGMGYWYIEQLLLEMVKKGMAIHSSEALVLGFTFKENCPDIRNTKVIDVINALNKFKIKNEVIDPIADIDEANKVYNLGLKNDIPNEKKFNIIIVAVAHTYFSELLIEDWKSLLNSNYILLDLKGIVPRELNPIRP